MTPTKVSYWCARVEKEITVTLGFPKTYIFERQEYDDRTFFLMVEPKVCECGIAHRIAL